MAIPKSPTSTEKKPSTRKAPARKTTAKVEAAPVVEKHIENHHIENHIDKHIPSYEEIARLAEQYWVERGRPFGSPEVDWLRAVETLQAA
ncbi:MAG TPA: DUF2934 domain-containing protein [Acidobacteriaceae bacterium]|nr:DUF2934 domain-containing protein [Acidobacteriaceae bacterium]